MDRPGSTVERTAEGTWAQFFVWVVVGSAAAFGLVIFGTSQPYLSSASGCWQGPVLLSDDRGPGAFQASGPCRCTWHMCNAAGREPFVGTRPTRQGATNTRTHGRGW
jgi:hypothetical protein